MSAIARLQKVPLRELWAHGAHGFTIWLCENLDFLGAKLNMELTLVEREVRAGPFAADILAEDGNGNYVVIENQLEKTDHDHLGKLITYLSNLEAKTAVWITKETRPEHEIAIHWLNEIAPADTAFYLLTIEAFRIGDSPPAPLLTLVVESTPAAKESGTQKKELAERHYLRRKFWEQLLALAREKTKLHSSISPSIDSWISASSGRSGLAYSYVIRMNNARVELNIDTGDVEKNIRIFEALFNQKSDIEERFGMPLEWQRVEEQRSINVRYWLQGTGLRHQESWPQIQANMVEAMVRLHGAFQPEIQRLQL